ncbi:MAG TPA: DNA polymerase I [Candidatus Limnocylindrales bacterium]|nr:DNA polymerase I [Candidatus Limnocylindrales bacterium]
MGRPLFYVLDGHALAYRNFYANSGRALKTSSGVPTSAMYGFTRTILDVLEKDQPTYMAVAFDEGLSDRETVFAGYKAHRDPIPPDLEMQIPRIREIVQAFGIPLLVKDGTEADDLIGTATLQAEEQGADVLIFSGDSDLLQLLSPVTRVRLFIPVAKEPDVYYDEARFRERYGLQPRQLIDLKALKGDSSDNIPGVAGVGEKTATALLQEFGTVEGIYEHLDAIKESTRKKLEAGRESAFMSKDLATIRRDVPFDFDFHQCRVGGLDREKIETLFQQYEFNSLMRQLARYTQQPAEVVETAAPAAEPAEPITPPPPIMTVTVQDEAALKKMVEALKHARQIAFDVEATSVDQMSATLVGISLSADGETGYYIPVGHRAGASMDAVEAAAGGQMALMFGSGGKSALAPGQLPLSQVLDAVRGPLTDPAIAKVAHNANYDLVVLQRYGIDVAPITFDTMIAEWVRDPGSQHLGLKRLAQRDLGVHMTEISELIGTGKAQKTMDVVEIAQAAPYAAADAALTFQLAVGLAEKLAHAEHVPEVDPLWRTPNPPAPDEVLRTIEMPLVPVIAAMERAGVLLDVPFLAVMNERLTRILHDVEREVFDLADGYGEFNINSPKQLNDVLFGKLGLKAQGIRKTAHGFSTAADVLDQMRDEHPIVEKILQYRELSKLKGTYVDALPALINPETGRVHTSFNQTGSSTGRLSSSNPNLQNIPMRTEIGRDVRGAFVTPPGMTLLAVDYSQVELRIMAHVSQEPTLIEAFHQGQDIHSATAALVNGIPLAQVTKDQRSFAKRVNFGLLYGMGAFRLARDSNLTLAEADAFIKAYFERLPRVRDYLDKAKHLAASEGYLTTMFGHRRYFPALQGTGNRQLRQSAEREAINMPIQGTAADIIKMAMVRLHDQIPARGLHSRMILQVHDELVFETPVDEVHETAALVIQTMEGAADLLAPLRANAQAGANWRDMEAVAV